MEDGQIFKSFVPKEDDLLSGFGALAGNVQSPDHRLVHSFCGEYVPGPLIPSPDSKAVLLGFNTNEKDTGKGFQLRYQFVPKSDALPTNTGEHFNSFKNVYDW